MIELNLVPDVKQEWIHAQRVKSTVIMMSVIFGAVMITVVGLLSAFVFGLQAGRNATADAAIVKKDKELGEYENISGLLTVQNQLSKISEINNSKKNYSRLFDILLAITPTGDDEVKYSKITVDSSNNMISLEAQSKSGYPGLEIFKKTLEGTKIEYIDTNGDKKDISVASSVNLGEMDYGVDSSGYMVLVFKINFIYNAEIFSPTSSIEKITITINGNQTDSYLGIKDLFAQRADTGDEEEEE